MSTISVDYDVLNQKGSPAWFSDTFANIPTAGYKGRMFISIDTYAFYRDTGTGWDLIGGPGTGTLTGSGTTGQVSFFNGTQTITGNNNLFWDNTNSRLGINTTTPGVPLDIHGTGTNAQFNGTGTNNAYLAFQNAGASKWRIGNTYNAGANSFDIYNVGSSSTPLSINGTTGFITLSANVITTGAQFVQNGFLLSYANAGGYASTTNIYGSFDGINFGLGTSVGGAKFIFQTAASYDYTFPATTGTLALTSNIPANIVTGTGASGQVAYWNGTATQTGTNNFFWDNTNTRLGINTNAPLSTLQVVPVTLSSTIVRFGEASGTTGKQLLFGIDSTTGRSEIQSVWQGTANTPLGLNVAGGNVLVGITTDNGALFQVNGSTTIGGSTTITAGNSYSNYALKINNSAGAEKFRVDGNGNTLIGYTTDQGYKFCVNGNSIQSGAAIFQSNVTASGSILTTGGGAIVFIDARDSSVSYGFYASNSTYLNFYNTGTNSITGQFARTTGVYTALCDINAKKDFENSTIGLNAILGLKPTLYRMKTEDELSNKELGFIAQEVKEYIPQAYVENKDFIGLNYNAIVAALVKSVQELEAKIKQLENKLI